MALIMHSLRGLTLSIAGLAWAGVGFHISCSTKQLDKALKALRDHGSMSKRDLQRRARFATAAHRDNVLIELEAEHLVKLEGKVVTAYTFEEFTRLLHHHSDLPTVPDLEL